MGAIFPVRTSKYDWSPRILVNLLSEHFGTVGIATRCNPRARHGTEGLMSSSISAREPIFRFPGSQPVERYTIHQRRYAALAAELQASLAREDALRAEKRDFMQRQVMLAQ